MKFNWSKATWCFMGLAVLSLFMAIKEEAEANPMDWKRFAENVHKGDDESNPDDTKTKREDIDDDELLELLEKEGYFDS